MIYSKTSSPSAISFKFSNSNNPVRFVSDLTSSSISLNWPGSIRQIKSNVPLSQFSLSTFVANLIIFSLNFLASLPDIVTFSLICARSNGKEARKLRERGTDRKDREREREENQESREIRKIGIGAVKERSFKRNESGERKERKKKRKESYSSLKE